MQYRVIFEQTVKKKLFVDHTIWYNPIVIVCKYVYILIYMRTMYAHGRAMFARGETAYEPYRNRIASPEKHP